MTATTALLEPTFVDLIDAIERAPDLSEQRRRHRLCSSRQIAKLLDRPAEVIPARWQSVRVSVGAIASRPSRRHGKDPGEPQVQCPGGAALVRQGTRRAAAGRALSAEWARFIAELGQTYSAAALQLGALLLRAPHRPSSVDDEVFDHYWRYRTKTTGRASNNTARRFMVRAWNTCAVAMDGWGLRRLTEPSIKIAEPAWDQFPEGLRRDIDDYFAGLAKPHRSLNGKRIQPCSADNPEPAGRTCRDGAHGG